MRVGIVGGSFNPPHLGHIHISKSALKAMNLDQIWWIPAAHNPLKNPNIYKPYKTRFELCKKIILANNLSFKIKVYQNSEIISKKLIESIKSKHPSCDFFWIMGADNLENLHLWHHHHEFIKSIKLVIVSRENFLSKIRSAKCWNKIRRSDFYILRSKNLDISSTKIRKLESHESSNFSR